MSAELDKLMDEMTRVTLAYLQDHPIDYDAYYLYVMSDEWKLRSPFRYEGESL